MTVQPAKPHAPLDPNPGDSGAVDVVPAAPAPPTDAKLVEAASGRRLIKNTVIYGAGMVLSRAASFLMLPVYTRLLTPRDYGLLQMLDITIEVLGLLVSAGCTLGILRFYFKAQTDDERAAVVGSQYALHIGLNLLGSALLALAAVPIWRYGLHGAGSPSFVLLAAVNFTLGALPVIPMTFMQIQRRATLFSATSLAKLLLQLSLNILFLVGMRLGPVSILLSTLIANVVIGSATAAWLFRQVGFKVRRAMLRELRRFGIPYQIAAVGSFVLTFGDRLFLEPIAGLAVVGIYSFAYQFGFLLDQIGRAPYARAWGPTRWEFVQAPKPVRDAAYNTGMLHLSLILLTTAVGIGLGVHPLLFLLTDPAYHSAADIVPVILAAYVIQAWGDAFQFGIDVSERTRFSTYAVWISVAVIIPLYATLIPLWGAYGAALATALSFAVRLVCLYIFAQRLWPVAYDLSPHLRLFGLGALVVVFARFTRGAGMGVEIVALTGLFGVYAILTWILVLDQEQRRWVVESLVRVRRGLETKLGRA